ncbi:HNH endonuclease [Allopseudospirillum japonicum]|nr:HNH endonuclease [Allopseudospirillum japonicum]
MSTFNKYFPIIARTIDSELLRKDSINRDEIIIKMLEVAEVKKRLPDLIRNNKKHNTPEKAVGNLVDWFSAEITKKSKASLPWVNKYVREKTLYSGRRIWEYRFSDKILENEIDERDVEKLTEGSVKIVNVNAYERNPKAREKCIAYYGLTCSCCGFDFFKKYGEIGQDFIYVHHLVPISEMKKSYILDPVEDLRPVCANCHAIIHRKSPPFTIEEIKIMIEKNA